MIKTLEDFRKAQDSIPELRGIPKEILFDFGNNLKFVDGHLAHADYSMLEGHVDDMALPSLFQHFGINQNKFASIKDSACVNRICFVHPGQFCDPDWCGDH